MSDVRIRWTALSEIRPREIVLRVAVGGTVTAAAGWVAHRFGPAVGGLFLSFPSILPAALTLTKQHEGRAKAAEEARGAIAGSAGLAVFGLFVWLSPSSFSPALTLTLACAGWLGASITLWRAVLA